MDEDNAYPQVTQTTGQSQQVRNIAPTPQQGRTVHDWIRDMRMSPDVNKTTVGVETDQVTPELMLATSRKLLGISRREQEPDPKDSLQFQRVYGPTDYFAEHIMRDSGKLGRNLLWKATNKGNLDFMPTAALDKHISDVFYDSKLANMVDGSSPLELMDASMKITRIGEGGVGDQDSAPTEMRLVQPSFMGFVDPARSVDSFRVGLDAYLAKHVKKGSDGKLYREMVNAHTGKKELVDSVTAARSVVTTPEMMKANTSHIYALGGKTGVRIVPKDKIDYYLPNTDEIFSTSANLVPMASGVKEMRLHMGCLHPATTLLYTDREGMTYMAPAREVKGGNITVPSITDKAKSISHIVRATIAKFPRNRSWFVKIVLLSGRTLITSKDHRWSIVDDDDNIKLIEAQKLKPGTHVLRTTFQDVPCRRTYINGICVGPQIARMLGYAVLSLQATEQGGVKFSYDPEHEQDVRTALEKLGADNSRHYTNNGARYVSIKDGRLVQWLRDNVHIGSDERAIPPEILSASPVMISEFLDGYTHDKTKVGIDDNEDYWLFSIANAALRDQLAFLWMRLDTDTCYRDAVSEGKVNLALQLIECDGFVGDCVLDSIKAIKPVPSYTIMVDVDVNDNLFATANGIITHNSKYALQAVPLDEREPQLVRTLDQATGKDMSSIIGKYLGAQYARKDGTVSAVRKDRIDVIYSDGTKGSVPLYRDYPMNAKGYIDNEPQVKAGQSFKAGDLLASSNYTDKNGLAAIGRPLRSAWVSWKGGTYEDGIVLSEDAAKKLTSTTMYPTAIDLDNTVSLGKKNYQLWKPGEYNKDQMATLDDDGVVKPGTVLHKGDPVVLAIQTTEPSPGTLGKRLFTDMSETWEHDKPGVVRDVVKTRKGVKVLTTVTAPVEVGDKLSNSYGAKGVVSQILPADQMPQDKDGNPMDMLFSPLSLISRTNASMLHEALLGKVAHKTGKPEIMPVFNDNDISDYVNDRLKQTRLKAEDDLVNPETGRTIPGVLNGYSYIYKLKHLSESKMAGRGTGTYSQDDTPTLGSDDGAKRYGTLESSAMAGHMAFKNLLDAKLIRGQANTDFWRSLRMGQIPVMPGEPTIHKKFFAHLQGAGVNVRRTPKGVSVFSLTNGDVNELAGSRELKSRDTYEAKTFRPIDGGLFGQDVFGPNGDKWAYIQLDEPLPNPVMEEPLARLLNISDKDFQAIVAGQKEVNGMKSPADMKARLAKMDLAKESADALREFKGASKSRKDAALKRYKAIELMRRAGENPAEYMLDRIPVLPPEFRPVTSANGLTMVADSNYLYAQMLDARNDMRDAKDLPAEYQNDARANIYRKWKELTGLYDPESPKLQAKNVKGLLAWAVGGSGTSPKFSAVQRKLIGMSVDTVGRGVVIPDPRVKLNEVGMPAEMAFKVFAPFVERSLVQAGYTPMDAMKLTKAHDPKALDILRKVMETHPVQMNRAPTLHKLSIMGFKPVLTSGHAIHVNPSIVVPLGMDFDGDQQIGLVKIQISTGILFTEENLEKISISDLHKFERILYYVAKTGKEPGQPTGDIDMAFHNLKTQIRAIQQDTSRQVIMDIDLADIPHGRCIKSGCGDKANADYYEALPGIKVLAYSEATGKLEWADIAYWSEHRGCAVEIVHLTNGVDIVTDDDPRAVYGIAKDADSLVPQRFTPTEAFEHHVLVPYIKPGTSLIQEDEDIPRYIRESDCALSASRFEERCYELDFDFGQLLGVLAGDGWWDKVDREHLRKFGGIRGVYLADNEGFNAQFVEKTLSRLVPDYGGSYSHTYKKEQYEDRYGDTVRYSYMLGDDSRFNDMLTDMLGGHQDENTAGSANKHLPTWVQGTPYEFRRGLLCGLIATDGSVSVSHAKKLPQLMAGFCSTSLRLCRGLRELCRSIGVRASITFSKTTARNNQAWQVTLSTYDLKKNNILAGLCHARKLRIFEDTQVSMDSKGLHGDCRVFPKCVTDVIFKWVKSPNIEASLRCQKDNPEYQRRVAIATTYQNAWKARKLGIITANGVEQLASLARQMDTERAWALEHLTAAVHMLENDVHAKLDIAWRDDTWKALHIFKDQLPQDMYSNAKVLSTRRCALGAGCQSLLDALRSVVACNLRIEYGLSQEPIFKEWLELCRESDCIWVGIESIEKTGKVETGYDLTVPGYETFMASSGVVLSNTANLHVPVSDQARKETMERMFPERNLIAMRNRQIAYKPEKEYIQGLYVATRMKNSPDGRTRIFDSLDDARQAQRDGIIDVDDPIIIRGK